MKVVFRGQKIFGLKMLLILKIGKPFSVVFFSGGVSLKPIARNVPMRLKNICCLNVAQYVTIKEVEKKMIFERKTFITTRYLLRTKYSLF